MQVGVLAAENAPTAATMLRSQGHHVLQLVQVQTATSTRNTSFAKALNYSSGPSQKDILDFTTQLAVMIRAGISIRAALDGISDQIVNPKFKKILLSIKTDVESGKQFSEAISKYLPGHHRIDGGFGDDLPDDLRAAALRRGISGQRIRAPLAHQIPHVHL